MANDRTSSPCDDAFIKRNIKDWATQNPRPTNEEIRDRLIAQGCTAAMVANYVTVASTVSADGLFSQSKTQKNSREAQYYSDLLDKFISKGGKPFSANLVMDENGKVTFDFPPRD